jgi:hypothetical protein
MAVDTSIANTSTIHLQQCELWQATKNTLNYFYFLPILTLMDEKRKAPRIAIMKRVEVLWEDDAHALRSAPATILDRAPGGVCIQVSIPIEIGSKLTMKAWNEQFSGVVVNSRREKNDYILGIHWDVGANSDAK